MLPRQLLVLFGFALVVLARTVRAGPLDPVTLREQVEERVFDEEDGGAGGKGNQTFAGWPGGSAIEPSFGGRGRGSAYVSISGYWGKRDAGRTEVSGFVMVGFPFGRLVTSARALAPSTSAAPADGEHEPAAGVDDTNRALPRDTKRALPRDPRTSQRKVAGEVAGALVGAVAERAAASAAEPVFAAFAPVLRAVAAMRGLPAPMLVTAFAGTAPAVATPRVVVAAAQRVAVVASQDSARVRARACVRAAWRAAGLGDDDARLDGLASRARASAVLPELRVRAVRTTNESLRLTLTDTNPGAYTQNGAAEYWLEARMTWRLNRLVFADEEVPVERVRLDRTEARMRIAGKVLEAFFEWQRARSIEADDALSSQEHAAAEQRESEARERLDVLTDGWFGAGANAGDGIEPAPR